MRQNRILKQKNELLTLSLMDLLRTVDPSKNFKYLNILSKHIMNKFKSDEGYLMYLRGEFAQRRGVSQLFDNLDVATTMYYARLLELLFDENDLKILTKFHDYCERGLITNCDTYQLNSLFELEKMISVVELNTFDKQLEKEAIKVLKTGDWLLVRPLTHSAAVKYGFGTKWCTSMTKTYEHFERYSFRGILIYIINLKTADKIAFFHNVNKEWDKETSFWNASDNRIDSIEANLPNEIFTFLKSVINDEHKVPNMLLMSDELKVQEAEYYKKYFQNQSVLQDTPQMIVETPVTEHGGYLRQIMNDVWI